MEHVARKKDGSIDKKLLPKCTLPLTGVGVIDMVITDMGVMEVTPNGLKLIELAPGITLEEIQANTDAKMDVSAVKKS
jgi:3-oxoacid CoA-transferase subunit B